MFPELPLYISVVFLLTTLLTLVLFLSAVKKAASPGIVLALIIAWLMVQAMLAINGFFDNNMTLPPRFVLAVGPPLLVIIVLFLTKGGRRFIDSLPLSSLTWLQTVRVPVEIVLYWLMIEKTIPQLMTFEGRNFDILAGVTAPFVAWYTFDKGKLGRGFLLGWNIVCLLLVLNIVINAALSVETPLQQFAFDQPNRAVLVFPYIWLPAFIVPVVIFSHLASIRQLVKKKLIS